MLDSQTTTESLVKAPRRLPSPAPGSRGIANRYEKMLLNFHDSISLNGNACRMFEFLGKRSRMALTGGVFGAEQGLAS